MDKNPVATINALDFFAIDYQEELSGIQNYSILNQESTVILILYTISPMHIGLSGDVLMDQTEFLNECIQYILQIYQNNSFPDASIQVSKWNIPSPFSFFILLSTALANTPSLSLSPFASIVETYLCHFNWPFNGRGHCKNCISITQLPQ